VSQPDSSGVTAAIATLVDFMTALERRVEALQITTAAIAGEHLRDEDVVPEVIRPGDQLRVATTALLQEWTDNAGQPTAAVLVKEIRIEDDGTKTLIVGPRTV
jgi:hypothetical protein